VYIYKLHLHQDAAEEVFLDLFYKLLLQVKEYDSRSLSRSRSHSYSRSVSPSPSYSRSRSRSQRFGVFL